MGKPFGRYELLSRLATGGMAEVFLAVQRGPSGFEKQVALKLLLPELAEDAEFVALFVDEARIAASLSHPNIGQIFELGLEQGRHYIAMELIEGHSLARILKRGSRLGKPVPEALAVYLVAAAADGLAAAHEKTDSAGRPLGIVHRDVSPQNVMVSYEGQVKIVDFGIAHAVHRTTRTRTGEVRGKAAYMAPEQVRGEPLDARADVFALGSMLYEVLTGRPMFRGPSDLAIMQQVLQADIPLLVESTLTPRGMQKIVRGALHRQLDERTPTARELARQLRAALQSAKVPVGPDALGLYIRELFEEDRLKARAQLDAASPGDDDLLLSSPGLSLDKTAPTSVAPGRQATRAAPRRRWAPLIAAITVAAAGGAGFLALMERRQPPNPSPTLALAATPPAVASARPEPLTGAAPAPVPLSDGHRPEVSAASEPLLAPVRSTAPHPSSAHSRRKPLLPAAPSAKTQAEGQGHLTFDSYPWTEVYLDGRKLGTTPLVEVAVPAGHHRLHAVNEAERIDRSVEVDIVANQTAALPRFSW